MAYASILIPHKYITAEILEALDYNLDDVRETFYSERDVLAFGVMDVVGGKFPELEELLVKNNIPFNRSSNDPEIERKFRPKKDGVGPIDVEVTLANGFAMIKAYQIREIIERNPDTAGALAEIKQALYEIDPDVSQLQEWADMEMPVTSTAEVELDRFSDIL